MNMVLGQVEERLSYMETDSESLEENLKVVDRKFDLLFVRGDVVILVAPVSEPLN